MRAAHPQQDTLVTWAHHHLQPHPTVRWTLHASKHIYTIDNKHKRLAWRETCMVWFSDRHVEPGLDIYSWRPPVGWAYFSSDAGRSNKLLCTLESDSF
mmetsp:Transcript_12310/g.33839  ORF Transcript_12310/g.33839 Transcript_12310/m.33839 type:complete len:98 (-) Transcript_12310:30-323(-)